MYNGVMRERVLTLEQIQDYLDCGLYYRYRHELGFKHYFGSPANNAIWITCKGVISRLFDALGSGNGRRSATNIATDGRFVNYIWYKSGGTPEGYAATHALIRLLILDILSIYKEKEVTISGDFAASKVVNGYLIEDHLEGLFIKTGKDKKEFLVAVQIDHDSQVEQGPRVSGMRAALVKNTLGKANVGTPMPVKLLRIRIPSRAAKWYDLSRRTYQEFTWLAKSVISGITNQIYLPTNSRHKCSSCCFRTTCSNYFCEKELRPPIVYKHRKELEK